MDVLLLLPASSEQVVTIFVVFFSTGNLKMIGIIIAVVVVLVAVCAGIGFYIYKKKSGERPK